MSLFHRAGDRRDALNFYTFFYTSVVIVTLYRAITFAIDARNVNTREISIRMQIRPVIN